MSKTGGEEYRAIVTKIVQGGRHGPYAVTKLANQEIPESITFALEKNVWQEDKNPEGGEIVVLGQLVKKTTGWRANSARYWRVEDEKARKEGSTQ